MSYLATTAKNYKRPTKKEKLGLSANQARASFQKNVQRNAPISAQFKNSSANQDVASAALIGSPEASTSAQPRTAIEQKAQKLLLEAEKRALARQQEADDGMDEDGVIGTSKKKTGASGMKSKAKKAKDTSPLKVDYVDLL